MPKYRKKPVEIEAIQWTGKNGQEILFFAPDAIMPVENEIHIEILEGTMKANINDFIIKGVKGEFYPCKPDIFAASYDIVESASGDYPNDDSSAKEV